MFLQCKMISHCLGSRNIFLPHLGKVWIELHFAGTTLVMDTNPTGLESFGRGATNCTSTLFVLWLPTGLYEKLRKFRRIRFGCQKEELWRLSIVPLSIHLSLLSLSSWIFALPITLSILLACYHIKVLDTVHSFFRRSHGWNPNNELETNFHKIDNCFRPLETCGDKSSLWGCNHC